LRQKMMPKEKLPAGQSCSARNRAGWPTSLWWTGSRSSGSEDQAPFSTSLGCLL
jgi:hypothetical protein